MEEKPREEFEKDIIPEDDMPIKEGLSKPPELVRKAPMFKPQPALAASDRLTMKVMVYHERYDEDPYPIDPLSGASWMLEFQEQPYSREMVVGEEWTPIDLHWLKDKAGLLVFQIRGQRFHIQPTEEEREKLEKQVLHVSYGDDPGFIVRRGLPFPFMPVEPDKVVMRSAFGKIRVRVTVFPR
jgi:hypothetical protein